MELIRSSNYKEMEIESVVIALGTFDGLHLGHRAVIEKTKKIADEKKMASAIYTFSPHPLKILKPAFAPSSLISAKQKIKMVSKLGIDYYFEQKFTNEFSRLPYQNFVKDILVDKINAQHIIVGDDFKFGKNGAGDIDCLIKLGNKYGFFVTGVNTVMINSQRISSTLIRELISKGVISCIPQYLGRYYMLDGKVIHGKGRGKKLGFPTANIKLMADYTLPPKGVYACYAYYQGEKYKGIANFGVKPTFADKDYTIEVHLLDFPFKNIYGDNLSVDLVDFIRKEITFSSSVQLIEQIKKDILYTDSLLCYN